MGSTQVGFKVCGSELRRSKDHKGKKVQNFKKVKLEILVRGTLKEITTLPNVGNWDF